MLAWSPCWKYTLWPSPSGATEEKNTQPPLSALLHLRLWRLSGYLGDKAHTHACVHVAVLNMCCGTCGKWPDSLPRPSPPPPPPPALHPSCPSSETPSSTLTLFLREKDLRCLFRSDLSGCVCTGSVRAAKLKTLHPSVPFPCPQAVTLNVSFLAPGAGGQEGCRSGMCGSFHKLIRVCFRAIVLSTWNGGWRVKMHETVSRARGLGWGTDVITMLQNWHSFC